MNKHALEETPCLLRDLYLRYKYVDWRNLDAGDYIIQATDDSAARPAIINLSGPEREKRFYFIIAITSFRRSPRIDVDDEAVEVNFHTRNIHLHWADQ